jgi:hypothetical protein
MTDLGYRPDGVWKSLPKFKCDFCKFTSTNEIHIRDHVITRHQLALVSSSNHEVVKPMSVPLYDSTGAIITERVVTSQELRKEENAKNYFD